MKVKILSVSILGIWKHSESQTAALNGFNQRGGVQRLAAARQVAFVEESVGHTQTTIKKYSDAVD